MASPQEIKICNQVSTQTREIRKRAFNLRRNLGCTWNLKWQSSPLYSTYDTHDQHECRHTVYQTHNKIWRSLRGRRAITFGTHPGFSSYPWFLITIYMLTWRPWMYPCSNLLLLPSFPFRPYITLENSILNSKPQQHEETNTKHGKYHISTFHSRIRLHLVACGHIQWTTCYQMWTALIQMLMRTPTCNGPQVTKL